jgi:hypothetical protein
MHDMDRTTREIGLETQELQPEQFEFFETNESGEYESGMQEYGSGEMQEAGLGELHESAMHEVGLHEAEYGEMHEAPLGEAEEMELASEFLEVTNEQELEQFLGRLIRKAGRAIGRAVRSPIGRTIGGFLKPLAKMALPLAGKALGGFVGGPVGALVGGKLASMAGQAFGLELEGMSGEDREFEIARRFVRFASSAAGRSLMAPPRVPPPVAIRKAIAIAARRHAPGIIRLYGSTYLRSNTPNQSVVAPSAVPYAPPATPGYYPSDTARNRGIWVRRGRRIIVMGV